MPLKLNSSGGGSVTLDVPSTASTFTATVPAQTGTLITSAGSAVVTPTMLSQPLTLMTAQTASGTSVDFTGIPSWAKRITVMFNNVSTNGTSAIIVQIGDAGGIETTGYDDSAGNIATSTASVSAATKGFAVAVVGSVSDAAAGSVTLTNVDANIWVSSGVIRLNNSRISYSAGAKSLSDTLDRVRITTFNGTDTFDAGTINILYEG